MGAQTQNGLANGQITTAGASGGSGSALAQNTNAAHVVESGTATGQTGLSAAEGAPAVAVVDTAGGVQVQNSSQTTSTSGGAAATGLTSQNNVSNSTVASLRIDGMNEAPVSVRSSNQVTVVDTGSGSAASGDALAKGGAATLSLGAAGQSGAAPPTATASGTRQASAALAGATGASLQATSAAATATGLTAANVISNSLTGEWQLPAGTPPAGHTGTPVSIVQEQSASVMTAGSARATSASTCAGTACGGATATPSAATATPDPAATGAPVYRPAVIQNESVTQASSGAAQADGLVAQNNASTSGVVSVRVGGNNFAPIQIVVDTITRIVNWGSALASSGTAGASGGAASVSTGSSSGPDGVSVAGVGTPAASNATSAASGSVEATGARVSNQVALRSTASVHVAGDNFNPLDLFIHLVASLVNRGSATAISGNAYASGSTGGPGTGTAASAPGAASYSTSTTATSGSARATGLNVQNSVDLSAYVSVIVDGSNYAPITLHVLFETVIDNAGAAQARSGDTEAHGASSSITAGASTDGSAPSGAQVLTASAAAGTAGDPSRSGTTTGSGGMAQQAVVAGGSAGAGAVENISSQTTTARGSTHLSSVSLSNVSAADAGSGSGTGIGVNSWTSYTNNQVAGVSGTLPGKGTASNEDTLTVDTRGRADIVAGAAIAGPTPTPTPVPPRAQPPAATSDQNPAGPGQPGPTNPRATASPQPTPRAIRGSMTAVNPWGFWPSRTIPPMPAQKLVANSKAAKPAVGSSTDLEPWDGWPDPAALEMPDGALRQSRQAQGAASSLTRTNGVAPVVSRQAPGLEGPFPPAPLGGAADQVSSPEGPSGDTAPSNTEGTPLQTTPSAPPGGTPPAANPLWGWIGFILALLASAVAWWRRNQLVQLFQKHSERLRALGLLAPRDRLHSAWRAARRLAMASSLIAGAFAAREPWKR